MSIPILRNLSIVPSPTCTVTFVPVLLLRHLTSNLYPMEIMNAPADSVLDRFAFLSLNLDTSSKIFVLPFLGLLSLSSWLLRFGESGIRVSRDTRSASLLPQTFIVPLIRLCPFLRTAARFYQPYPTDPSFISQALSPNYP